MPTTASLTSAPNVDASRTRGELTRRADDARFLVALFVVATPIVVATGRALVRGWQPLGDNGLLLVRSRDVLTRHHPWLGSWSSSSLVTGDESFHVNNPGPLYLDLIAAPIKLLGPRVGLATGVMLVNVAAVVLAVIVARRIGGVRSMAAVALMIALTQYTMGSELLFDVWQPNATVLVFLAFGVVVWGLATGDFWMAPWVLGIGSVLVQTHLSFVYLVVVLTLTGGISALVLVCRGHDVPKKALWVSAAVVVLAWFQPVIDQFFGRGNLHSLLTAAGDSGEAAGPVLGTRLAGEAMVLSGWWTRSSFESAVPTSDVIGNGGNVPVAGLGAALLALLVVIGVLACIALMRILDRPTRHMAVVGAAALMGAWISAVAAPLGVFGVSPHQVRWMWPSAALASAAIVATVMAVAAMAGRRTRQVAVSLVIAAACVAVIANLPTHAANTGPTRDRRFQPSAVELIGKLDALKGRGTVLFDTSTLFFAEPYSGPLFAELQDKKIEFVIPSDSDDDRQLGASRRFDPKDPNADLRVWLATGDPIAYDDPRIEVIAAVQPLTDSEREELDALDAALRQYVNKHGLTLSAAGEEAVSTGHIKYAQEELDQLDDPFGAISIDRAVEEGWLELDPAVKNDFKRYADLIPQRQVGTVTLYAAPLDVAP